MQLMFDSHLDLSLNALSYDRDQTLSVEELRRREANMNEWDRGLPVLSLPELRRARVGVVLATVLARARPNDVLSETPPRKALNHGSQSIAYAQTRGQLGYYQLLEAQGELRMICDGRALREHWAAFEADPQGKYAIGLILSMEGADPIVEPEQARHWFDLGLRTLSLAHYGPSAYAYGTGGDGPLTDKGRTMLPILDELGMILDLTHTSETSFSQALDLFGGRVFASHNNCRELVPGDRQFSDDQIQRIIERDGVIGGVFDAWMLSPDYQRTLEHRERVTLADAVAHIDHVCQLAGNARHAAIGSDLDGGFDAKQCPRDLDVYSDLHKLEDLLAAKGYSAQDIAGIFHGNWLRFFSESLPEG